MFRTELLSIIRSFNTVFTATGICHSEILKLGKITSICVHIYICIYIYIHIQSVPGGICQTSGECSLC
jgi:hypothetical protein